MKKIIFGLLLIITLTSATPAWGNENVYYDRFIELFNDIQTKGYLSPEGVPYHSIEELMVEAPDYGHLTTSEAFSFLTWLGATYGRMTGDWSYYKNAWNLTEQYIIPDPVADQPGVNTYPPSDPAQYAPEMDLPSDYPVTGEPQAPTGIDPIADELRQTYGTAAIYQMHWLLDVDNWYQYGNHGDGTSRCSYINTYQRGPMESVWKTVPHPSWEDFSWGAGQQGGFLPLFGDFGDPARQWRYTSASDADARQVQAAYWALLWAREQGVESELAPYTAKAAKMGDYLRYTMFDKYFRPIGVENGSAQGSGYDSCHYLLSWYASWGGGLDGGWSWRIGSSHSHQGYQNPLAAYALSNEPALIPLSPNAQRDWAASYDRQLEFFQYLQSAEGAIAGGVTNSWKGRYLAYPSGQSTFYDMAYDWQPVYHDPPSNNWFGFQTWSMERIAELYYLAGNARAKNLTEKWVNWAMSQVRLHSDGTFEIPAEMSWSGQPDTWTGVPTGNRNLHCTVTEWGTDLGVTACLAKALTFYAAAAERWEGAVDEDAKNMAGELLDRMWNLYRTDKGLAAPEPRADYSQFFDEVYIPPNYSGVNAQGARLQNGMTFIDMRPSYLDDPDYQKVLDAYNAGEAPVMLYHRFWAQADIAMANAMYHLLFVEDGPIPTPTPTGEPTPTPTGSTPTPTSTGPTPTPTPTPSFEPGQVRVEARREESNPNVQSLIRMNVWNEDNAALNNLAARYFVDLSEVYAAGYSAGNVTLDVYYSSAGVTVSPLTAYDAANRIYYYELDWGSYSLAPGARIEANFSIHLTGWQSAWDPANDWSYQGLSGSYTNTPYIPVYRAGALIYGLEPDGSPPPTPTPTSTVEPTPTPTGEPTPTPTSTGDPNIVRLSDKFETAWITPETHIYAVQNNIWGADTPQTLEVNTQTGDFTVITADHNNSTSGAPASYPFIWRGNHWGEATNNSNMPVRVGDIGSINTTWSTSPISSGAWNVAMEAWFHRSPYVTGDYNGAELMVWINWNGPIQPSGQQIGTVQLAGATWEVWYAQMDWNYIAYRRINRVNSVNIDFNIFVQDAVSRGYISDDWYLCAVEAGFELWQGGAGLASSNFSTSVETGPGPTPTPTPTTEPSPTPTSTIEPTPTPTYEPEGDYVVDYVIVNDWGSGATIDVTITNNTSATVNGWTLAWTFPGNQQISNLWGGSYTQTGASVSVTNLDWNADIVANGGSVNFGFNINYSGINDKPTAFTLNGTPCEIQ